MNILTNSNFTNNGGPTIVETVNRRIFNEHEKVKFRVQPLVHNKWHKSLELLEKGKENGLILSTAYDIDIKKDGYEAFVLAEKYHKGFSSFDSEEGKKSGGDFLRIKPVPTIDSKSNQNTFLDSFSCRLMYEKELIRCEKVMKPVYIALFKMRIRALASAFNHLLKFMLHRRAIMRRAGEDRLANRRAQTHFFFVMTSKTFTAWYDYVVLQKERLMRLRFVLNTRRTNYFKLAFTAWKVYLIEIVLKNSKTGETLIQNLTEKPEKRLFGLWKLHAYQRRLMRKTGFRIQEARSYFLHAAFHIWYANSLFVLIQNRSYYRLKSRCFQKLIINVKNEYVIYKITKRARRKRIRTNKFYRMERWLKFKRFKIDVKEKFERVNELLIKDYMIKSFLLWKKMMLGMRKRNNETTVSHFNRENWLDRRIRESKQVATGYWTFSESLTESMNLQKKGSSRKKKFY